MQSDRTPDDSLAAFQQNVPLLPIELVEVSLESLSPAMGWPGTDSAQRYLAGTYDSVERLLQAFETLRVVRRETDGDIRGRMPENEVDLLRAAVVFTGAGLDATLKQLVRDTLPLLLSFNQQAHDKFESFAVDRLRAGDYADARMLARYLTSGDPRDLLIEDYIRDLTGSSLQSAEEVQLVAGALGIEDSALRMRISGLRPLFIMRNQISHELDLQRPEKQGDRSRRIRTKDRTIRQCHEGLEVGQQLINAAGAMLSEVDRDPQPRSI